MLYMCAVSVSVNVDKPCHFDERKRKNDIMRREK
jgi:hypothetical protein